MVQQGFFLITKILLKIVHLQAYFLLTHKMILLKKHFNTVMLRSTLPLK